MAMNVLGKQPSSQALVLGSISALQKLLLSKGCNVVIADLTLRPEAQELISKYPLESKNTKAIFQKTDVTDWAQLDKIFEVALKHFGGADIVCPGAGVYEPPFSNFWVPSGSPPSQDEVSQSRYSTLDINLTHPIRLTQLSIAHFLARKKPGAVVHISSVAGQVPFFPTPLYVASKHALNGFVRSLSRLENPPPSLNLPKIRVVSVAPARVLTPLWTDNPDKLKMVPRGDESWIMPEAVADVMLDLVQEEEYVGGTVVEVGEKVRIVDAFNDPGPEGGGNKVGHDRELEERDMWDSMGRMFNGA